MARDCDVAGDHLRYNGMPFSAWPITMACWFNVRSVVSNGAAMSLSDGGTTDAMEMNPRTSDNKLRVLNRNGGVGASAVSDNTWTQNVWSQGIIVTASDTSRFAYLDNGTATEGTASSVWPTLVDEVQYARSGSLRFSYLWIAECAIWTAVLTAPERKLLSLGMKPKYIRPASLAIYSPLGGRNSPEISPVGGYNFTLVGTCPQVAHPPMMSRPPVYVGTPEAAAEAIEHEFFRVSR
jgi:hypothetical protein